MMRCILNEAYTAGNGAASYEIDVQAALVAIGSPVPRKVIVKIRNTENAGTLPVSLVWPDEVPANLATLTFDTADYAAGGEQIVSLPIDIPTTTTRNPRIRGAVASDGVVSVYVFTGQGA